MANLTIKQKKEWARMLYLDGTILYTQAEISEKVGISRITLGRWIKDEKWAELRVSVTMTREQSIKRLYRQIDEVLGVIERRPCGERYPSSQESDTIKKITASIKDLESEVGISEVINVSVKVCDFVRKYDIEKAKEISNIFDQYIKSLL